MTDREKAIVMAYTGICMLTDDKFQIFHKYVENIMGRSVWTHEMALDSIADEIRAKSKNDFIALCADEGSSENPNKWIPVSERLPEEREWYLAVFKEKDTNFHLIPRVADYIGYGENKWRLIDEEVVPQEYLNLLECVAWMPLPEPYKAEKPETCKGCTHPCIMYESTMKACEKRGGE